MANTNDDIAEIRDALYRVTTERNALAETIVENAKRAGIVGDDAPIEGPHLLMLVEQLGTAALRAQPKTAEPESPAPGAR